jgi:outer membrane protein assembly factor BamD
MRRSLLLASLGALALGTASPARAQMSPGMGGGMGGMGGGPPPGSGKSSEDLIPEVDAETGKDAQRSLARAEQAYGNHDWLEAIAYYRHVVQKFAYNVPLAAQAELRLGDVAFERGKWAEARGYYRNFLRFHPRHERADYASFRVGLAAFKDIPGGMFFEPPREERDQAEAKVALRQMGEFIERFPQSSYVAEAQEIMRQCEDRLAAHELYVARFYAARERWKGVILRAEGLVRNYPHSTLLAEAMALVVEAHANLGERDEAQRALQTLEALEAPKSLVEKARRTMDRVR